MKVFNLLFTIFNVLGKMLKFIKTVIFAVNKK